MKHTITIENGVTIINTGDAIGGLKNKTGHVGIHYIEDADVYLAKISIGKKYHHLGRHKRIEDAIAIRKEAEWHRENGTFMEWWSSLKFSRNRPRKK